MCGMLPNDRVERLTEINKANVERRVKFSGLFDYLTQYKYLPPHSSPFHESRLFELT